MICQTSHCEKLVKKNFRQQFTVINSNQQKPNKIIYFLLVFQIWSESTEIYAQQFRHASKQNSHTAMTISWENIVFSSDVGQFTYNSYYYLWWRYNQQYFCIYENSLMHCPAFCAVNDSFQACSCDLFEAMWRTI